MTNHKYQDQQEHHKRAVPKLDELEIETGRIIGMGEFCTVREVMSIQLSAKYRSKDKQRQTNREFMSTNYLRSDDNLRYALKRFRHDVVEDLEAKGKTLDVIHNEAEFLKKIDHPNIIKMRAVANCRPMNMDYFIVIDRLKDILQDRIYKEWKPAFEKSKKGMLAKFSKKRSLNRHMLTTERVTAIYDLVSALKYLHRKK